MPLDLARIRALCFDIDGTLSDTDDHMVARFEKALTPFRRLLFGRLPHDIARRIVMGIESPGNLVMSLPDIIGLDDPLDRLTNRMLRMGLYRRRKESYWLIPGVREALEKLKDRYPMAVVSARDESGVMDFLNQHELLPYFQHVASAHTVSHTKPYPDPILWVAGKMGVSPGQCLMVGDTTIDIRAGKSAGTQTIGVLCGFGEESELRRAGADLVIPSTSLLPDVLENH
jgi:HAD superfamily hydrolase (TIGR01509 family)